jgi:hypothetical protein
MLYIHIQNHLFLIYQSRSVCVLLLREYVFCFPFLCGFVAISHNHQLFLFLPIVPMTSTPLTTSSSSSLPCRCLCSKQLQHSSSIQKRKQKFDCTTSFFFFLLRFVSNFTFFSVVCSSIGSCRLGDRCASCHCHASSQYALIIRSHLQYNHFLISISFTFLLFSISLFF